MKKIILQLLFLLIFKITYSQEGCTNFKIGNFQNLENGILREKIHRNDSIQTEQYGKIKIKLKINWIDDCTYRLIFLEGNKAYMKSRPKDKDFPDLIVKITKINGNQYTQESKFDNEDDSVYISEILKID